MICQTYFRRNTVHKYYCFYLKNPKIPNERLSNKHQIGQILIKRFIYNKSVWYLADTHKEMLETEVFRSWGLVLLLFVAEEYLVKDYGSWIFVYNFSKA